MNSSQKWVRLSPQSVYYWTTGRKLSRKEIESYLNYDPFFLSQLEDMADRMSVEIKWIRDFSA